MSDEPSRGGKRKQRKGAGFIPWMSKEDVQRRVDMRERDPEPAAPPEPAADPVAAIEPAADPVAAIEPAPAAAVTRSAAQPRRVDPRRVLWRDSATILVVVVLALLGAQALLPRVSGGPVETAIPSGVVIGSLPPGSIPMPHATFPPIVDPSLGLDATPTPIPVITLAP